MFKAKKPTVDIQPVIPEPEKAPIDDVSGYLSPDAVYFTTRKLAEKWVAEKLFLNSAGELVREQLAKPSTRWRAMRAFKVAMVRYWTKQR
jgi:hypothetical protein